MKGPIKGYIYDQITHSERLGIEGETLPHYEHVSTGS